MQARRQCSAGQRDDIEQEAAERGGPLSGGGMAPVCLPAGLIALLCQTKHRPAPNQRTEVYLRSTGDSNRNYGGFYTGTQGETPDTAKERPTDYRATPRPYQGRASGDCDVRTP
jgi:hypothetical protein